MYGALDISDENSIDWGLPFCNSKHYNQDLNYSDSYFP